MFLSSLSKGSFWRLVFEPHVARDEYLPDTGFRMNIRLLLINSLSACFALSAAAQIAVQDGFESGAVSSAWAVAGGIAVQSDGGANGTAHYARLGAYSQSTGRMLEADFTDAALDGAKDFYVDCFFRIQDTTQRQFNLHIAFGNTATVNLRYQASQGGWAVYDTAWRPVAGLGSVTPEQWYRLRLSGYDWGNAAAHYEVQLSDAGTTNFTSGASNLTIYQSGNPQTTTAKLFRFTTEFGNNPGFDVDEVAAVVTAAPPAETNAIVNISGTYPHLAVFSEAGEIGIGAVVPWAGKLWFVTYPPHAPNGSSDKLWMVDSNLTLTPHPVSVGGTHANRLIHRESQQLNIGPYFIDATGGVRVVSPSIMPGRLTGSARHLIDPANKIYIATMEEGLYEVNVHTLAVMELYHDLNSAAGPDDHLSDLPGQHGKGLYSAQGRLVYSNNGNGGVLASWDGLSWTVVQRAKFTEVTGPGGIYGNSPDDDRLWALGWDDRSVILKLLQDGVWHTYRLPKGSYTHDADHGWFTEWPRIREIVDGKMLMHMHGLFYYFPKTFSVANTAGIDPICSYLKMPVDYCWWNGQLVMGRDDASTTGGNRWAGQSHSAPWFGQLSDLERWGPPAGFGGPWKDDDVVAGTPSEPFLINGFQKRILHLKQTGAAPLNFALQYDANGTGTWTTLTNLSVAAQGYTWYVLPTSLKAVWVRLVPDADASGVTAYFHLANPPVTPSPELFAGIADAGATNAYSDGIIRPREGDARTLQFAVNTYGAGDAPEQTAYYEIGGALQLRHQTNATAEHALRTTYGLANADFSVDAASVIVTEGTNRFRLPKNDAAYDMAFASGWPRGRREVVTERDLFQAHGTFYELPKSASGGFRRVRPVCTHHKHISDFASWRGMLAIAGMAANATTNNHVYRSADGQAALWFGNVDDLWRMGAPAGVGGPWKNTAVTANIPSDPYLMYGYENKVLELSHQNVRPVTFTVEVDFAADNTWSEYGRFKVEPGETLKHIFPAGYSAHWVRLRTDADATVTATFTYGPSARIGTVMRLPDDNMRLTFNGPVGLSYSVRASAELSSAPGSWETLAGGRFGAGSESYDVLDVTNWPQRFYVIAMP